MQASGGAGEKKRKRSAAAELFSEAQLAKLQVPTALF